MRYNISMRDSNGRLIRGVSQWDVSRTIRIKGLSVESEPIIRVCNAESESSIVLESTMDNEDVLFTIPNELTQVPLDIRVFVVTNNGAEYMTICKFVIPVSPQTKPEDYDDIISSEHESNT